MTATDACAQQTERMGTAPGFIAALDQSGGSTPKALKAYGVEPEVYGDDKDKMFDLVHEMRTRIITSPSFTSDHILAAILFEMTMDREIEGIPTGDFLWQKKGIVPFLKIDKGLADEESHVRVMKPIRVLTSSFIALSRRSTSSAPRSARSFLMTTRTASRRSSISSSSSVSRSAPLAWCRSSSLRSTSMPRTSRRRRRGSTTSFVSTSTLCLSTPGSC